MIHVTLTPLHAVQAQALFRPSATDALPISPAGAALDAAAGAGWIEHSLPQPDLPLGSAILTPAGDLSAEFVVHLIVRSPVEPVSERTVTEAVKNGLRRCAEWAVGDIALPLVGTGPGDLSPELACAILAPELVAFTTAGDRTLTICAADEFGRDTAIAAFERSG